MTLLDVGVWLAAVWGKHVHHRAVSRWFTAEADALALCRITQMGLLRLLSNASVMGDDVVTRSRAWRIVDELQADERIVWLEEPSSLEPAWRALSARRERSHALWTDDYLAAFAQTANVALATLDRGFLQRYPSVRVNCLL
jgi:toxin-antitoxin system PIN domain toxin